MSKVLIIEDNNDIRDNIIEILTMADYQIFEASNGKTGVAMALKNLPDIILCDIMMPELDGYGVLHLLNKHAETSMIPFIFITARSERLDLRKGMELGADDYLTKPFDDLELLNAIESRLKKKNLQQDFYSKSLERLDNIVSKNEGLNELKKIISDRKNRIFKKNQVLHYEGDRALGVYLIIIGKVKTVKMAEDGRELMTGIYQAEDFLGVNIILGSDTYLDTATALEDSQVCFFPKEQLEELLLVHPDIAGKFITILSGEIRDKDAHLLQLAYQSVRKRIAEAILRIFRQNTEGESISVTRDNLAAMSGTASETVSRTLTEFRNEGLIGKQGSNLTILDLPSLTKMKN